jgi:glutaryl-CoA dehydrogenase
MWITNSPIADVFVVWAKDDEGAIRGFVLEKGWEGLSAPAIHGKVGLRASITGEIVMDNVFCPEENAFPDVRGLRGPFTCLDSARYGISWGALGAAEFCWHTARQYTMDRQQFGKPTGGEPADPEEAGRHADRDHAGPARLPAPRPDEGRRHRGGGNHVDHEAQLAAASRWTSPAWPATCWVAMASATSSAWHPHMVNLEVVNTYEGTHDVHALILGRAQTGIQAFF